MAVDEIRFRAMASGVQVLVVDGPSRAADIARRVLDELEHAWSRFIDDSDISRINHANGQPVAVQRSTLRLVATMVSAWRMSEGRYDPTILRSLMDSGYVASIDDPAARTTLPEGKPGSSGAANEIVIDPDKQQVQVPAGMTIDAGGVGKGLAADLLASELLFSGAAGALVSIGGDLAAVGTTPEPDGWRISVEDHRNPAGVLAKVFVSGGGVATSSTRTRRWRHQGHDRHHVIDPRTGDQSDTDLVGATVVAPCGWQAEAHATGVLLGGSACFERYCENSGVDAIATTTTGRCLATDGFSQLLNDARTR